MDERDFELLKILNKTKNITHAADLLYLSQSALSKRIASIEQELSTTIILRSSQGIHFTPEGEEVLRRTQKAADQLQLMRESIELSKDYVTGTLNAGISINYALFKLPDILATYRKQFPHVNTNITTNQSRNLYLQVLDRTLDVAIIRGEFPWKGHKILLERENICAITSIKDKNTPLNNLPFIGRKTDLDFERKLAQWMNENNLHKDQHGIYVDNIITCVEMVKRGLGWAVVPEICLKDFSGHVRPLIFENGEPFERSTYLIYTDIAISLPQVEAFINIVRYNKYKGE